MEVIEPRVQRRVVGLDLTPELLDIARRRAERAGVGVEWLEGDAESLPPPRNSWLVMRGEIGWIGVGFFLFLAAISLLSA